MKRWKWGLAGAVLSVVASVAIVKAANVPLFSGPACSEPSQLLSCLNQALGAVNSPGATGINPNTMSAWQSPRNFLDNGAMQIQQRGTGIQTGQINGAAVASANYAADRWFTSANVAAGAPRGQVTTTTPAPPIGFPAAMRVYRNSGALTQQVCAIQVIPTYKAQALQGQQVVFSAWIQALAGLGTDQGAASQVVNLVIITGTGSDEGLGTWTAAPAITPAWTGVATLQTTAAALPSTPAWARYQGASVLVPTTVNEIAVALCFTPTATGAGTTDGFAFTGAQLEQGGTASPYEFRSPAAELIEAQRYYQIITEAAAGVVQIAGGTAQGTTTTCTMSYTFPVQMRVAPTYAPVPTPLTASTFKIVSASQAATALGTPFAATLVANTVNAASINFTTTGMTAKDGCVLVGAGGGAALTWSADF